MKVLISAREGKKIEVEITDEVLEKLITAALGARYSVGDSVKKTFSKPLDPSSVFLAVVSVDEQEYKGKEFQFLEQLSVTEQGIITYRYIGSPYGELYLSSGNIAVNKKTAKELTIENPTPITKIGAARWEDALEDNLIANMETFRRNYISVNGTPYEGYESTTARYVLKQESIDAIIHGQQEERNMLCKEIFKNF